MLRLRHASCASTAAGNTLVPQLPQGITLLEYDVEGAAWNAAGFSSFIRKRLTVQQAPPPRIEIATSDTVVAGGYIIFTARITGTDVDRNSINARIQQGATFRDVISGSDERQCSPQPTGFWCGIESFVPENAQDAYIISVTAKNRNDGLSATELKIVTVTQRRIIPPTDFDRWETQANAILARADEVIQRIANAINNNVRPQRNADLAQLQIKINSDKNLVVSRIRQIIQGRTPITDTERDNKIKPCFCRAVCNALSVTDIINGIESTRDCGNNVQVVSTPNDLDCSGLSSYFNINDCSALRTSATPPPSAPGAAPTAPPAAPQCPINPNTINTPTVTLRPNSEVTLSWASVPGATSYNIRLSGTYTRRLIGSYEGEVVTVNHIDAVPGSSDCPQHYVCENGIQTTTPVPNVPVNPGSTYTFWVDPIGVSNCNVDELRKRITFTVPSNPASISPVEECPLCESRIAYDYSSTSPRRYTLCQSIGGTTQISGTELDFGSGVKLVVGPSSDTPPNSEGSTLPRVVLRLSSGSSTIAENLYASGNQFSYANGNVRVVSINNIGTGNCARRTVTLEITPRAPTPIPPPTAAPTPQDTTPPEVIEAGITQGGQAIQNDGIVNPSQPFTATARVRDPSGIDSIRILVNNNPRSCTPSVTLPTTSGGEVTCRIEQSSSLPANSIGTHVIQFEAIDNSPNKNRFISPPFYVNVRDPNSPTQLPPYRVALSLDKRSYVPGERIRVTVASTTGLLSTSVTLNRKLNGVRQNDVPYGGIGSCVGTPCTFELGPVSLVREGGLPEQWEAWITATDAVRLVPVDSNHVFYTVAPTPTSILRINNQQSGLVQLTTGQPVNVKISNAPSGHIVYLSLIREGTSEGPLNNQRVGGTDLVGNLEFQTAPITSPITPGRYRAFAIIASGSQPTVEVSRTNTVDININVI
ncbi:hypothetical protein HYX00_02565 [Candidatus Woesearchaeota archaeon]|nr:hypothetical protein [Candidatus Woesearchaeota archaeon]